MKDIYAERLLAQIMGWDEAHVQAEQRRLQLLARYKYDEYQRFRPGRRFIESLALWLRQFRSKSEREAAYEFVINRLVFLSRQELTHLVQMTYPDIIVPEIIDHVSNTCGIPNHRMAEICRHDEFLKLQRRSLFLGLSDGARTDELRRFNPVISNEQIWHAYELSKEKAAGMHKELNKSVKQQNQTFRLIWLLDDFSGSGRSYIRFDDDERCFKGKITKVYEKLLSDSEIAKIIDIEAYQVYVILYVATAKAKQHIEEFSKKFTKEKGFREPIIKVVQCLEDAVSLSGSNPLDKAFLELVDKDEYYDPAAHDDNTKKGGTDDVKRGFANCALPVALAHNTPNNSVYLLWGPEQLSTKGLFPRVTRHKEF